jgi:hypothetical protein
LQPFYLLVFIAGLLIANLLLQLLRAAAGGGEGSYPFERRPEFLTADERLCLGTVEEAVGTDFRVFVGVCLSQILQPDQDLGRRRRGRAAARLWGRSVDLLVCSAADGYPLCALLVRAEPRNRATKRELASIEAMCRAARLPVLTLALQDHYEITEIRRRVLDAVETAEVRIAHTPEPPAADEEALLAELAASMQEPDGPGGRRMRGRR